MRNDARSDSTSDESRAPSTLSSDRFPPLPTRVPLTPSHRSGAMFLGTCSPMEQSQHRAPPCMVSTAGEKVSTHVNYCLTRPSDPRRRPLGHDSVHSYESNVVNGLHGQAVDMR